MEITSFKQKLSSCEGVTEVSVIRDNVVKLNLEIVNSQFKKR